MSGFVSDSARVLLQARVLERVSSGITHRILSSSFRGLLHRILNTNHEQATTTEPVIIVNPQKLEAGLRTSSAWVPYALLLRIEAIGLPTFRLLLDTRRNKPYTIMHSSLCASYSAGINANKTIRLMI